MNKQRFANAPDRLENALRNLYITKRKKCHAHCKIEIDLKGILLETKNV